jgi:hypothetical protein
MQSMLDLNHGGAKPPSLASELNALIDRGLEQERAQHPRRQYLGMSEISDECARRVYYEIMGAPARPISGTSLRAFRLGHALEAEVAAWLLDAGFDLITSANAGRQFEVQTAGGRIKGHIDGVLAGGPPLPGLAYPAIWENKALAARYWGQIVKEGLEKAHPKYYGQCQLYLAYFKYENGLFTALNKNTSEIYPEVIAYDAKLAQELSDRGADIVNACLDGQPPPRLCGNADAFHAKYCRFALHCFGMDGQ